MRILALIDSVSLPRQWNNVSLEDTYLSGLNADRLWLFGGGGKTVTEVLSSMNNILTYMPDKSFDLGIIALGLVDCAPHPVISSKLHLILPGMFWGIADKLVHKFRPCLQRLFGYYQQTSIENFIEAYRAVFDGVSRLCNEVKVIPIPPILKEVELRSPGLNREIARYNQAIYRIAKDKALIIPLRRSPEYLTKDVHITTKAHSVIAQTVR